MFVAAGQAVAEIRSAGIQHEVMAFASGYGVVAIEPGLPVLILRGVLESTQSFQNTDYGGLWLLQMNGGPRHPFNVREDIAEHLSWFGKVT